jgi:hypothetical protein
VIVTVLPEMVAGPEAILNVTASPEDEVALTVNGGLPKVLLASAPNVIVWLAFATVNDWSTGVAALKLLSPPWKALTTTVPAPVMVTVLPLTVAGPDTIWKVTGSPDDAAAVTVNGALPYVLLAGAPKVIVWLPFAFVRLNVALPAPRADARTL